MPSILRSAAYISAGLLLTRVLGLARDLIVAAKWGASEYSDLVLLIINFPDMIVGMLVGAALSSLLVPRFVQGDLATQRQIYSSALVSQFLVGALSAMFILIFAGPIAEWVAPGFSAEAKAQTAEVFTWISIAVLFAFLTGVPRAYLLSQQLFNFSSFESVFFNLPIVITLFSFTVLNDVRSVVIAILFASVLRFAYLFICSAKKGVTPVAARPRWHLPTVLRFSSLNAVSGSPVLFLFIIRAATTALGAGNFTLFSYFVKLLDVPMGILSTIVFSVALPHLSSGRAVNNRRVLALIGGGSVLVSALVSVSAWALQGRGFSFFSLTSSEIDMVLAVLAVGSWALPTRLIASYLQSLEFANQRSVKSLISSLVALGVGAALVYSESSWSLVGLAWALNIYHAIAALILLFLLRHQLRSA